MIISLKTEKTDDVFHRGERVWFGFFSPSESGRKEDAAEGGAGVDEGSSSDCLPCQQGCTYCKDDAPCVAQEDGVLRLAVLSFQCLCMLIVFISMVLVYHFRRNKVGLKKCCATQASHNRSCPLRCSLSEMNGLC